MSGPVLSLEIIRTLTVPAEPGHPPLCVITSHPAKYRDPKTGLPYANSYAYREIQRVHRGDYKWSRLVGAWVGRGNYAARGVPEWFLDPSKASKAEEPVLVPKDGVEEVKVEEEGQRTPVDEPRLELAEPLGAEGVAPLPVVAPSGSA